MPLYRYRYRARDKDGALHTGTMEAARKEGVADQLSGMGHIPVLIEEPVRLSGIDLGALFARVTPQDLFIFSRQLATLMSAGIPLIQGLVTLERQSENPRLKAAISQIRHDIEGGSSLSDDLARQPKIFNKLYVSLVRAGETAGILDEILSRLVLLAEHEAETRVRVKTAFRYSLIVVTAISAVFAFLVTFVIPKFSAIFPQFKKKLPLPTRILISINYVV